MIWIVLYLRTLCYASSLLSVLSKMYSAKKICGFPHLMACLICIVFSRVEDYDPTPTPTPEISKMPTPTPTSDFKFHYDSESDSDFRLRLPSMDKVFILN